MAKVGSYTPDQPSTFQQPATFRYFPQFCYYLRRSPFVRIFGYSPDEAAFYRHWLSRSTVTDCMIMIQPNLICYWHDAEPANVLLDVASRKSEVILLLDTFFSVVKWTGDEVAEWRKTNIREEEEYKYIGEFMDQAEDDTVNRCRERFPYPTEIR
eukprot:UN28240